MRLPFLPFPSLPLTIPAHSINPKSTFALLKPHIPSLIEHFIFPLVCLSEEEIELFSDDPTEFSRQFFGGPFDVSLSLPCG